MSSRVQQEREERERLGGTKSKDSPLERKEEPMDPFGPSFSTKHPETFYHSSLSTFERLWVDRYNFFLDKGYRLRPRYRPGWRPSWLDNGKPYFDCEDYIRLETPHILDAERVKDGTIVCMKMLLKRNSREAEIALYLSSQRMLKEQWNHSAFVLDHFGDCFPTGFEFLVMPLLRRFDDPPFCYVGEVVDFVTQVLEGLVFLHSHHIAHNDLSGANIMMDARPLYPSGWHPISNERVPDLISRATPLSRIDNPVKYYIIDFGIAHRLDPSQPPLVVDFGGRDKDVPELKVTLEYNPFKVDVFTTGNTFYKDLWKKYHRLDFLTELIVSTMTENPEHRPTASMVLEKWYRIEKDISHLTRRLRLQRKEESLGESIVKDAVAIALQAPAMLMGSFPEASKLNDTQNLAISAAKAPKRGYVRDEAAESSREEFPQTFSMPYHTSNHAPSMFVNVADTAFRPQIAA